MPDQLNTTNIPSNRVEFIDPRTGLVSREWYRFFLNLFTLAGSGSNQITLDELQIGPPPQPDSGSGGGGGSGTVTSVDVSGGTTGLTTTGGPVTSSGTITLGGTLNVANGGTGATTAADAPFALKGANADITSMSGVTGGISTPDYIDFDTTAAPARATGRLWWDNADGIQTLNLGMAGTNATMQVGQESYYRIKASSAITEGQVVMFTGTVGASGALTGAPATGLTASTAQYVMGVATESIAHNGWGYVTEFGLVRGIDTSGGAEAWVDGQILYYDPTVAGGLTKTLPSAPNAKVVVAAVVYASASNGSLFIRPSFGGELGQYEGNVGFGTLSNGDLMQYDSGAGKWTNVPSSTFGTGSVTSVDTAGTVNGLTLTGGPITTSGTITLGGTLDLSSPPMIGNTTPNTGTFTTLIGGKDQVNYGQLTGGATTKAVEFKTLGSDTNVALAIRTQGTGAIDLAAGSSGVNISNGGTVTAITRTAGGTLYTTPPSIAITAPTTAGGVQATATCTLGLISSSTIGSGGTGYTVNDVLTLVGGTSTVVARITVTSVSAGVITGFSIAAAGTYTAAPTNPASLSGGTGSGATLNTNFTVNTTFTITNAGSGYVEQPTVSFSGGGGSGAAAYAKVGTDVSIKSSLNGVTNFVGVGGGTALQLYDAGGTSGSGGAYWKIPSNFSGTQSLLLSTGEGQISSTSTNNLRFFTNTVAQEQLRVSHTASAVNYVQVTGAATGATPAISAQGSDTNIPLALDSKGSSSVFLRAGGLTAFATLRTASSVNYLTAKGSIASSPVELGAAGTDTNIDLTLTPKGTGVVRTSGTGIRLYGSSSGYVGLKGAAAAGSTTYTLPAADGTSGQVLSTDGAATLSWATPSGGSSNITAQGMWENALTISSNYTITSGNSAMSAGPITIASGVSVTVPSGSRWVVV